MYERKFNFVKRQPKLKFRFVERESRMSAGSAAVRGLPQALRNMLLSGMIFVVFIFGVNLIVRYGFEKLDISAFAANMLPFSRPMYFISKDNLYTVYSNGKIEFVDKNVDSASLPFLTGIDINEKDPAKKKAFKMALAINKKYLRNISEIRLNNPENIILITLEGSRKIYSGAQLTNTQLENYNIALDRITRPYATVDLRYRDRVIIK
jgi:hypothetical protein